MERFGATSEILIPMEEEVAAGNKIPIRVLLDSARGKLRGMDPNNSSASLGALHLLSKLMVGL